MKCKTIKVYREAHPNKLVVINEEDKLSTDVLESEYTEHKEQIVKVEQIKPEVNEKSTIKPQTTRRTSKKKT